MHNYDEPVYLISIAAKVLDIHPQTLRQYEREGFVEPSRTSGKVRMYSQRDIDQIKMILRLTRDLRVNIAGVDVVLRMKKKIEELENDIHILKQNIKNGTEVDVSTSKTIAVKRSNLDIIIFDD